MCDVPIFDYLASAMSVSDKQLSWRSRTKFGSYPACGILMIQVFASFVLNFGFDILDCGIPQEVT